MGTCGSEFPTDPSIDFQCQNTCGSNSELLVDPLANSPSCCDTMLSRRDCKASMHICHGSYDSKYAFWTWSQSVVYMTLFESITLSSWHHVPNWSSNDPRLGQMRFRWHSQHLQTSSPATPPVHLTPETAPGLHPASTIYIQCNTGCTPHFHPCPTLVTVKTVCTRLYHTMKEVNIHKILTLPNYTYKLCMVISTLCCHVFSKHMNRVEWV